MVPTQERLSPRDRTREDIYDLIRAGDDVTRTDLATATGLSRSTVQHAIDRLLVEGRIVVCDVRPKGPGTGSGRPAAVLRAASPPSAAAIAGIDFGHNHIYVAVADSLGSIVGEAASTFDVDLRATEAMRLAGEMFDQLRHEHAIEDFALVVAGIPGPLDRHSGLVRSPTILSSWVGLAPSKHLEQILGFPVHIENDAVLGAHGELRRGAGRHYRDFLYVKVSNGIGASIVADGRPYTGDRGLAGEIGHNHIAGHVEVCRCGHRGCLEAAVGVRAIRDQIARAYDGMDVPDWTVPDAHDDITKRILSEAGRTLGRALADLCNLLNPGALIIGGELGASGPALLEGVDASIRRFAQPATSASLEILSAELGVRAELVGAVSLAAELTRR